MKESTKVIVVPTADMHKPVEMFAKMVADKLGVCAEDVVVIPGVASLTFAAVPTELLQAKADADKAKAKAEADAAKEAEAAAKAEAAKDKKAEKAHA